MKIKFTHKEVTGYFETIKSVMVPIVGEEEFEKSKNRFMEEVKNGIKEGALEYHMNAKMQIVFNIDEAFVTKLLVIFSKYLAVVVPQIIAIVNLTKNTLEEIDSLDEEFREDPETEKETEAPKEAVKQ